MKSITVYHYDAFSKEPGKGNPAGVVFDGGKLTDSDMQHIASQVGFNETAFPLESEIADLKIRFFTPGHEMNLCGHATMATVFAFHSNGLLDGKTSITIETKAGILPITIQSIAKDESFITMKQATPEFKEFNGSKQDLAKSIGLEEIELHDELPILYGSTGTWTLLVPIKSLSAFNRMKPNNNEFPSVLKEMPKVSVHPFCMETYDRDADMHARHFSSPFSGTIEDAVTGTASGVMGAYYATHINTDFKDSLQLLIEQGQEINKDGRVIVDVSRGNHSFDIAIRGSAVFVKDFQLLLE
ncbi:PhzF family phenazine biosynthesis protein [Gracilibacillus sp. S3-1-1]|uniref:PhzF family phenazine biosynthesis protein n=1 Tax=Gracilibacillus pellucidus TaxID=3095368 RepID=A0ACC6M783_9BACI|nr:PhzF family phenazine biosynthesis protein [Gracilibacillus sp. S3-1-1]MDX8046845.1 PhzF family phenazine biosynthesis protein [Gracilibacillus sp. S3-1-1]